MQGHLGGQSGSVGAAGDGGGGGAGGKEPPAQRFLSPRACSREGHAEGATVDDTENRSPGHLL